MPLTRGRDKRNFYRYPNYRFLARCVDQLTEALRVGMIERVCTVQSLLCIHCRAPDPDWIRIQSGQWMDPGGQK